MFFFFPFAVEPAARPAFQRAPHFKPSILLREPKPSRARWDREDGFASVVFQAGDFGVDLLKRVLSSITSSMTALGNGANALFAQIAASLAFERMARETASFFGAFWPAFRSPAPEKSFAGWMAPVQQPWPFPHFGLPGFQPNPLAGNPWGLVTEALDIWTNFWMPAVKAQARPAVPVTAPIPLPFCWSFAFG